MIAAILILAIIGVIGMFFFSAVMITLMRRQRADVATSRRIVQALIELGVQLEHEERRSRHAIKNLCYALTKLLVYWEALPVNPDFTSIAKSLEEPPLADGRLVEDLLQVRERAGVGEEALAEADGAAS